MDATQINERFTRLILAQHEVVMALAALQVETVQTILDEFPAAERRLLPLVNETGTAIQAATLLLSEVPDV